MPVIEALDGAAVERGGGRVPVHPGSAAVGQDRPAGAVAYCPVDGRAGRWRQRYQDDLGALAARAGPGGRGLRRGLWLGLPAQALVGQKRGSAKRQARRSAADRDIHVRCTVSGGRPGEEATKYSQPNISCSRNSGNMSGSNGNWLR
jgi:hypothetical protein